MRRRRRQRHRTDKVELNLAAMLDMAFQLLAFFILTFRPAPVEGHLQLHLPPPVPLTNVQGVESPGRTSGTSDDVQWKVLHLFLTADDNGDLAMIAVDNLSQTIVKGKATRDSLKLLSRHLRAIFDTDQLNYEGVQLAVDGHLRYDDLMRVVDVCTQQTLPNGQKVTRVGFTELPSHTSSSSQ